MSGTALNILNILYRLVVTKQIMRWVLCYFYFKDGETEAHKERLSNLPKVTTTSLNYPD